MLFLLLALALQLSEACDANICRQNYNRSGCASLSTCAECLPFYSLASPGNPQAPGNTACSVICSVNASQCATLNRLPCRFGADQSMCGNCVDITYMNTQDGPGLTPCIKRNSSVILAKAQQGILTLDYDCQSAQQQSSQIINDLASSSFPSIDPNNINILNINCPTVVTFVVLPSINTSYITPTVFMNQLMSQINKPGSPLLSGVITSQASNLTSTFIIYQYCSEHTWHQEGQCLKTDSSIAMPIGLGVGGCLVLLTLIYITYAYFKQKDKEPAREDEEQPKEVPLKDVPAKKSRLFNPVKEKHPNKLTKGKSQKSFRSSLVAVHPNGPTSTPGRRSQPPSPNRTQPPSPKSQKSQTKSQQEKSQLTMPALEPDVDEPTPRNNNNTFLIARVTPATPESGGPKTPNGVSPPSPKQESVSHSAMW